MLQCTHDLSKCCQQCQKDNNNFLFIVNLPGVVDLSVVVDAMVGVGSVIMGVQSRLKSVKLP